MIVLICTACPECRVVCTDGSCGHRKYPPSYLTEFVGTATVTSSVLDNAKTFKSIEAANRYYEKAKQRGVKCTTLKAVSIN